MADHPPPWRWTGVDDYTVRNGPFAGQRAWSATDLVDADGKPVATVTNSDVMDFAGAGIRELLAAAPEMEALLRRARFEQGCMVVVVRPGQAPVSQRCGKCDQCLVAALLARLDAARKAGG